LGVLKEWRGDYETARALHTEALTIRRQINDREDIALSLFSLGNVALAEQAYETAAALYEESLQIAREIGGISKTACALYGLGRVHRQKGETLQARTHLTESLKAFRSLGNRIYIAQAMQELAHLAQPENPAYVVRKLSSIQALRESLAMPLVPRDRVEFD